LSFYCIFIVFNSTPKWFKWISPTCNFFLCLYIFHLVWIDILCEPHSRGGGEPWTKFTLKPATIFQMTMGQCWLGITKSKKLSGRLKMLSKCCYEIFKKNWIEFSTDWLTNYLMPSDKHNSIMARTMSLIFSLFNVASAQEVLSAISLYMQCILHGLTSALLCVPFIFSHCEKCQYCGRYVMASIHSGNHPVSKVLYINYRLKSEVAIILHYQLCLIHYTAMYKSTTVWKGESLQLIKSVWKLHMRGFAHRYYSLRPMVHQS